MITRADGSDKRTCSLGFTLIEVLLTMVLVLLLVSAAVFSFSSMQKGVELDEGAARFETLLRFARAEAANRGRKVQLIFPSLENSPAESDNSNSGLRLVWEPDPIGQPGVFQAVRGLPWQNGRLSEMIRIVSVEVPDAAPVASAVAPGPDTDDPLAVPAASGQAAANDTSGLNMLEGLPPITFYPDGSSDTARVVLGSMDPEDARRIAVQLDGITGAVRRELLATEEGDWDEADIFGPAGGDAPAVTP